MPCPRQRGRAPTSGLRGAGSRGDGGRAAPRHVPAGTRHRGLPAPPGRTHSQAPARGGFGGCQHTAPVHEGSSRSLVVCDSLASLLRLQGTVTRSGSGAGPGAAWLLAAASEGPPGFAAGYPAGFTHFRGGRGREVYGCIYEEHEIICICGKIHRGCIKKRKYHPLANRANWY